MAEIVLGFHKLSLVGAGPFPAALAAPAEIDPQEHRWPTVRHDFTGPYSQVLILAAQPLGTLRLSYVQQPEPLFDELAAYWLAVGGMEGTFPFTHPLEGWTKRMRFASEVLAFGFYDKATPRLYDFAVDLEEAP
jgi:hypothetical protein